MDKDRGYRRRTFLIKRSLQLKYATLVFVLFGVAAFTVWWETYRSIAWMAKSGLITDPAIMYILNRISHVLLVKVGITMLLAFFLAVLLSHYVAGPLYRVESALKLLGHGDLSKRVLFRRFDQVGSLDEELNQAMAGIKDMILHDRERIAEIVDRLQKVGDQLPPAAADELRQTTQDLKSITQEFTL